MSDADDFDFLAVLLRSFQLWLRAPHVHLLMGLLMPAAAIASFGALLGPMSVGYFRYLRKLSLNEQPPISLLWSGFGREMPIAMWTGLTLLWGTIAGLALGVLPGLVFVAVFGFAVRSVADGAQSVRAAMRASLEVAKSRVRAVGLLYGFALALQIVGAVTVIFVPLTNGLTALLLSEGRERMFL